MVEFLGSKEHPSSCFTLTGAISCGVDTEPAKGLMREMRLENEARQQELNRAMALAEGAPNLMQRLSRFPTTPHVVLCSADSLSLFACVINTTFRKIIHIRWCCIDQLRPPVLIG
jgi:hypothetical protein